MYHVRDGIFETCPVCQTYLGGVAGFFVDPRPQGGAYAQVRPSCPQCSAPPSEWMVQPDSWPRDARAWYDHTFRPQQATRPANERRPQVRNENTTDSQQGGYRPGSQQGGYRPGSQQGGYRPGSQRGGYRNQQEVRVGTTSSDRDHRSMCIICMDSPRTVQFLPCRHHLCCETCSNMVQQCPTCRGDIQQRVHCAPHLNTMGNPRTEQQAGNNAVNPNSSRVPQASATTPAVRELTRMEAERVSNFQFDAQLGGQGGQATIFRGMLNQQQVAAKRFRHESGFAVELGTIRDEPHPNVIRALAFCRDPQMLLIVYPLRRSLDSVLPGSTSADRLRIIKHFAAGIEHLHTTCRRCHRDIKPDNCVVDVAPTGRGVNTAFVIDLGISRSIPATHRSTQAAGTMMFIDPDSARSGQCRLEHDMYSLALFIACVANGVMAPNNEQHCTELLRSIPSLTALLHRMQSPRLDERPAIGEVCRELNRMTTLEARTNQAPGAAGDRATRPAGGRDSYQENLNRMSDVRVPLRQSRRPQTVVFTSTGTEGDMCAICQDEIQGGEEVHATPCNHLFHKDCINRHWQMSHLCPVCRNDLHEEPQPQ